MFEITLTVSTFQFPETVPDTVMFEACKFEANDRISKKGTRVLLIIGRDGRDFKYQLSFWGKWVGLMPGGTEAAPNFISKYFSSCLAEEVALIDGSVLILIGAFLVNKYFLLP